MKLNKELLNQVEELTETKYRVGDTDFVSFNDIENIIEALVDEITEQKKRNIWYQKIRRRKLRTYRYLRYPRFK